MDQESRGCLRLAIGLQVLPLGIRQPLLVGIGSAVTPQEIPIGASVLGTHQDIDQGIDAGGQIDEKIASDIEPMHLRGTLPDLGHRDGQVADHEPHKDHQYHLEESPVLGAHLAGINGGGVGSVAHGGVVRFPGTEPGEGGAQGSGDRIFTGDGTTTGQY